MTLLLFLVSVIAVIIAIACVSSKKKVDTKVDEANKKIYAERDKLLSELEEVKQSLSSLNQEKQTLISESIILKNDILHKKENLSTLQDTINSTLSNQTELSQKAFENYCDTLDNKYKKTEEEYNKLTDSLEVAYSELQLKLLRESDEIREELDKMRSTRAAAQEAFLKEKEIEKNKDDFRLNLEGRALGDIKILKSIQDQIYSPIVIDKIIWSNYYQPLAKTKFPKIIGKATCCGVYKITNSLNGEVYIGQSVDVCDRWKQHCKNALGIGTAAKGNKLYSSMDKYGLYNFTFEVLEECPSAQLDEKEKYYISLYDSYNMGLNSTAGNN